MGVPFTLFATTQTALQGAEDSGQAQRYRKTRPYVRCGPLCFTNYGNQLQMICRRLSRQAPLSRQAATDEDFLSIKEALDLFVEHGRPVTERTLQRYCDKQHLTCQKRITSEGEKWFALKSSVVNRIAELDEFDRLHASRRVATSRETSATVAHEAAGDFSNDNLRQPIIENLSAPVVTAEQSHATSSDQPRQIATSRDLSGQPSSDPPFAQPSFSNAERDLYERLLAHLEEQNEWLAKDKQTLQSDKDVLVQPPQSKAKQIERFFASERDTKTLFGSLQSLINGIWPRASKGEVGERYVLMREALDSGLESQGDERGHDLS